MYTIIEYLTTWKEIKEFLEQFNNHWEFRGQQSYSWGLKTGLDRLNLPEQQNIKQQEEDRMLYKLDRHSHNIPSPYSTMLNSTIQRIAFLQHFGAPTRLLDFTNSPFVALYFAIENSQSESSLFAFNRMEILARNLLWINTLSPLPPQFYKYTKTKNLSDPETFDGAIFGQRQFKFAGVIQPYFMFDRIINQSGSFLCQGDINDSFENNLSETLKISPFNFQPFYKIKIPIGLRLEILRELKTKMNIDRSTLFPGIDGFAQSLAISAIVDLYNVID